MSTSTPAGPMKIEDFVQIKPVIMEDFPDAQNVFFVVGNQRFCIIDAISEDGCPDHDTLHATAELARALGGDKP